MGLNKKKILMLLLCSFMLFSLLYAQNENENEAKVIMKKAIFYVFEDSKDNYQIGVMGINGEDKKVLTKTGNNWCPTINPVGDKVVFFSDRSGFVNLWMMKIDGSQQVQITDNEEYNIGIDLYNRGQISWRKGGEELFFLKKGNIWKIDRTGETPTVLTQLHDIRSFKISPDGQMILFARERTKKHHGIWKMTVDAVNVTQLIESNLVTDAYDWGDDKELAYFANRSINTISELGVGNKRIMEIIYPDNEIAWSKESPDRNQNLIAFINDREDGIPNIWVMLPNGKRLTRVTSKGGHSPCWFGANEEIYYVEDNDIYRSNMKTGEKVQLTHYFLSFYPVVADIRDEEAMKKRDAK